MQTQNDNSNTYRCNNLFTYGTLQSGQSRNQLILGLKFEPAILRGYRKISPKSLGFPFIIRETIKNSYVNGEIYYNLTLDHWVQIDGVEGEGVLYHRILVEVELPSKEIEKAYVYYPSDSLINRYRSD